MHKLNIAGFATCGAFKRAVCAVQGLAVIFPTKIGANVHSYETRDEYMTWLAENRGSFNQEGHKTSPFVWFDDGKFLGGCDDTLAWCRHQLNNPSDSVLITPPAIPTAAAVAASVDEPQHPSVAQPHSFDYDIVVIGGGSGGLACAKEAKRLGVEKVAVLDFVKPSPHGSKWGLGGTCVNVGCIPKKLMHTAALLGQQHHDAHYYGWSAAPASSTSSADGAAPPLTPFVHNWSVLKDRVQDHIKGLNFGYRVQLREKGVTYLNKLGRFIGPNELECTDAKGKVQVITANRFVVAVGGRPQPLSCPGAEFAITSDDLFMKETPPGKTCVIGAGYVALECAGFIAGLKQGQVVVLVRSMLLRGFDRDLVDAVQTGLTAHGAVIKQGVLPSRIDKLASGKLLVTYSNGESDEFDTVLTAVGRSADTSRLGLEAVNVTTNPSNGKIICSNEQTNVPHIFAVGDVVQGVPELTPSAILAGRLLARRLFDNSREYMDYRNIATTVFTPLELGTVGYTEEDAIAQFGVENVDSYVSSFTPLEWAIVEHELPGAGAAEGVVSMDAAGGGGDDAGAAAAKAVTCLAKIVVNKNQGNRVLGMHIASPNAGEIIQGFAVAVKKGITYKDLVETVGIHPTIAEEFTVMEVTKSSGASAAKKGC